MKQLKAAVIGCGRIGTFTRPELRASLPNGTLPLNHAEAILANKGLQLIALCDLNSANLMRASADYGIAQCFDNYRTLIQETRPDILSIATRTLGRCDILKFAAENGVKGVHLEKPISNNLEECREAIALVKRNQVHLTYGTVRRFMEIYRRAKEMLNAGEIGNLVQISLELGRTLLLWNHPHSIDMMMYFSGSIEVEYIQGNCIFSNPPCSNPLIVDDDPFVESAMVKFTNGVSGLITSRAGGNVTLCGTDGNLIIAADGSWLELQKRTGKGPYFLEVSRVNVEPEMSGTQRAFFEIINAIQIGTPLSITPEEIETSQEIIMGIAFSSLQNGRRIETAEIPAKFTVTGKFGDNFA